MAIRLASSRSNGRRRHQPMSEINVTPMVDVMLVLLIIFMVAAPLLTAGVEVNLPESSAAPITQDEEPLVISIDGTGAIFIQDTTVDDEGLVPRLTAITEAKTDTKIYVRGDRDVDYGRVMQVMGMVNAAGFSQVSLITIPQDSGSKQ